MPQVTITFEEDGQPPASFLIPDWAVAALQQYVDDPANPESPTGKVELFRTWAISDLIKPLCQRYNSYPSSVLVLLSEKAALDAQVVAEIGAAMTSAVSTPD